VLGVGLLTMKRWARKGSMMYARIKIILGIISIAIAVVSLIKIWPSMSRSTSIAVVLMVCKNLLLNLVYPAILLIFMKTAKIKRAFAVIGG
jgi:hypothetical protein